MYALLALKFQLIFLLLSFCATTVSPSSGFYDGKNRPELEENEIVLKGTSPPFTENLVPLLDMYRRKNEDLLKPDKKIQVLDIHKADSHPKVDIGKSVPYRHRAIRDITFSSDDNLTCHSDSSCIGKCSSERDPGPTREGIKCFCDEHCIVFQDCCADYEQACPPVVQQNSSRSLNAKLWQCNARIDGVEGAKGVWMISTCPANWARDGIAINCTDNVSHLSEDCQDFAPVVDGAGNTFKNRFCALCHGITTNKSQFYEQHQVENMNNVTNTSSASRTLPVNCSGAKWKPPPGVHRRYCLRLTRNESCFNESFRIQDHSDCLSRPPGIVKDINTNFKLYFNRYCALCTGVILERIACLPTKLPVLIPWTFPSQSPISLLFSPNDHNTWACEPGHVLDPASEKCKKPLGNAKPSVPFHNRYTITVQFTSRSPGADSNSSMVDVRKALESALRECSAEVFKIVVRYGDNLIYSARITVAFPESKITQNIPLNNCNLTIRNTRFVVKKGVWEAILCAKIDIYNAGQYAVIRGAESAVYINRTGELIHKIYYWSNQTVSNDGLVIPVGDIHVCRKTPGFYCTGEFIQLEHGEYVILSNGYLYRNDSNTLINDFVMVDGKPAICISPIHDGSRADIALVIISYVGIGLSVVCLSLVIITYSLFKDLRTVPGVNLMNLSFSLLVTHSLSMATSATHNRPICTTVAVLLHYFYMSSFVWMSIIAFDTYRTFSRTCYTRQETGKLKARFFAIGWFPALVFVVTCFSLDQSELVAIGYGGSQHCWINNPKSNTYVFVIPVALSVLFNGLFFPLTVVSIRKIKKQTQRVGNTANNQRNLVLFVKLAVLMGFTWIFGYLKILVSDYFDYPFVILTSFQGVYIAFGFVFTARVKKMYGKLFSVATATPSSASSFDTRF